MILKGSKKVEFRKTRFGQQPSHVVIYATAPIQKVIGFFEVEQVDEATPEELWVRHECKAGLTEDQFWDYYGSAGVGVAISVRRVFSLRKPLQLSRLGAMSRPPQSFCYLSTNAFARIKAFSVNSKKCGNGASSQKTTT